jgi:4-amino-4-deoxy-L-arabinose transferase-like glycosyltransferase
MVSASQTPAAPPAPTAGSRFDRRGGRREWLGLGAIVLAAALVRLPGLFGSLWYDEVMYTRVFFDDPGHRAWLFWKDVHPPLYPLLLWLWSAVFGNHEAVLRLPSYLAGLGSLWATWALARRWLGPRYALVAGALLAFSPPHIWYSVENKTNMVALFLSALAVWACVRAAEQPGPRRRWAVALVLLLLALATHAYALLTAGTLGAWLGWRAVRERGLRWPAAVVAGMVLGLWLPVVLWKTHAQGASLARAYLRPFDLGEIYRLLCLWFPHGNVIRNLARLRMPADVLHRPRAYFVVDAVGATALFVGLVAAARLACKRVAAAAEPRLVWAGRLLLLWFVPPLLLLWLASLAVRHLYIERNLLLLLPAYALLLTFGAARLPWRRARAVASVALVGLAMAAALIMVGRRETVTVFLPKVDWRGAAAWLLAHGSSRGALTVVTTSPTLEAEFYLRPGRAGVPKVTVHEYCSTPVLPVFFARRPGDAFWLVRNHSWEGCWTTAYQRLWNGLGVSLVDERHFSGLDLYQFAAR